MTTLDSATVPATAIDAADTPASTLDRLGARLRSAALAAIPAGLVVAVASYIAADIAAVPFLWILALALYLLSFVAVFRDRPWLRRETLARLVPIPIGLVAIGLLDGERPFWPALVAVNFGAFFLLTLLCHGELYRGRPGPARLTEFYLWTLLGGVLGAVLAAFIAPHVFSRIYEYPILIVAAVLVLPGTGAGGWRRIAAEAGPALIATALAVMARLVLDVRLPAAAESPFQILLVALVAVMLVQRERRARFAALLVLVFVLIGLWQPGLARVEAVRSVFGVHQVVETADGRYRLLYRGGALQDAERIRDDGLAPTDRPEPLTYYYFGGPISESIEAVRAARGALARVAVIGLGAGSLACHRRGAEQWTFFELDRAVEQIARDRRLFSFISSCAPDLPVVLGDARLMLTASAQKYDLIIVDAFSADAVAAHLLTREALAGYLARLDDGGVVVMHISSPTMELGGVVAAAGAAEGLIGYGKQDRRPATLPFDFKLNAQVSVLARKRADLGDLPRRPGWREVAPEPDVAAWTDRHSNILGAILRKALRP
jgi:hypothetical protein